MKYLFCEKSDYTFYITKQHSRIRIGCYSKQKMEELYPNGGYEVIGEIGNFANKKSAQDVVETSEGQTVPIFPCGILKKPFEWVEGYAEISENLYVAVVKSIIPYYFRVFIR